LLIKFPDLSSADRLTPGLIGGDGQPSRSGPPPEYKNLTYSKRNRKNAANLHQTEWSTFSGLPQAKTTAGQRASQIGEDSRRFYPYGEMPG
jgi:hypothetical protein